ncbi:GntR family transcriptional regulator [Oceanibacterium hippocampi]|uniref:HTH-type transcriptional repressor YvoA n=1 Tax=Oceanibacterium hippocampi TaxID=745714 RepID=A0A1Y5TTT3_9PROT|nr:GntR family transcriptional regulator [Oceanibacterium hippocampi]SLN71458.1 HTH-type transcriptional repressor YvoA [Oceanibacterium hippocampi]
MPRRTKLDQDEITPLHHQVYLILRQHIEDGEYPVNQPMPSEPDFTEMFGVSRITVRRALDRLQSEGLITRSRGRGTFPLNKPKSTKALHSGLNGIFDNLVAMGLRTKARLIEFSYILPPDDIRQLLELPEGEKVQRALRVRSYKNVPFSHLTTFVPKEIGSNFSSAELEEKPLLMLLEEQGRKIDRASQAISARLADHRTAQLLDVNLGSALLCVKRLVRDVSGAPVEYLEALYRPDMYEYSQELTRGDRTKNVIWQPVVEERS